MTITNTQSRAAHQVQNVITKDPIMTTSDAPASSAMDTTTPPKPKANNSRTAKATKARMKTYDQHVRKIVKHLKKGRSQGFVSTANLTEWLNCNGIPAPHEIIWTKSSVLRALRRLRELGLEPKLVPGYAKDPVVLDLKKPAHYKIYLAAKEKAAKAKASSAPGTPTSPDL